VELALRHEGCIPTACTGLDAGGKDLPRLVFRGLATAGRAAGLTLAPAPTLFLAVKWVRTRRSVSK